MLKIDFGWEPNDVSNVYLCQTALADGVILALDSNDTSTVGPGDCPFGNVAPASIANVGDREIGVLLFQVKAGGASATDVIFGVLNEVTATGWACNVWHLHKNDVLSTDSFLATGTGAITAGQSSGNTARGTLLGLKNGQYVVASAFTSGTAGSVPVAKLDGNTTIGNTQLIRVQVL
jgi:hypothetical protein